MTEVYQQFSAWATHVIRLYKTDPMYKNVIEVEWTAGPIPVDTPWFPAVAHDKKGNPMPNIWGKELIVRYTSDIKSDSTFYTDSNGKEMVKRVYNKRGPSYPHPYNISEPVAGNYYPVNAMIALDDGKASMAVITDVSMGGASLKDGQLELMVHRRVMADDHRGVQEPLNETMCGCNDINAAPGKMGAHGHLGDGGCLCEGLTIRGRHFLMLDTLTKVNDQRRVMSEVINYPPSLAFSPKPITLGPNNKGSSFSALSKDFPPNVKLVTLTNNYQSFNNGSYLLRVAHLYSTGESTTLAQPVNFSLSAVFAKSGLTIDSIFETSLTGNQPIAEMDAKKFKWPTMVPNAGVAAQLAEKESFTERVPFDANSKDLSVTLRPMEVRTFLARFN
jgi:alpha-mannosidase